MPHDDDRSLLERLLDCHARIREMMALASDLANAPPETEDDVRDVAERIARYFTRALPMHTQDEEESILPRLVDPGVRAALDRMREEHHEHEPLSHALIAPCQALAAAPERWSVLRYAIRDAASALEPAMRSHLAEEERDVFPHLEALDDSARQSIIDEMGARRAGRGGGGGGRGRNRNH
ncbi:hemerythrin domain-containing protein [Pendulispora albinea]|uniref:Hemerythrin domain-containing protein n=1 Tax=Pendulispora albinea TaxID=2741071 RepID=A0ABZ2LX81_9BACT